MTDADDIVDVTLDGDRDCGARARRRRSGVFIATSTRTAHDIHAIVHTHAPFATTLACLDRGIPAFHYMVAVAGGTDIRCAPLRDVRHAGAFRLRRGRDGRAQGVPDVAITA